ncbi:hypothetical protein I871_03860 [Borrelia miyamotoi LB-2001]|uniref:hypothetical protein n=1 Tax=Borrelia miyamotoi TaxID=47466 RepID=UPI000387FA3E|nr:hypothetical protein [Borrelia miyamotoi]AGT27681.1 hypothetical protein I871_03860 [Borrelia miyamotoi LB-2001]
MIIQIINMLYKKIKEFSISSTNNHENTLKINQDITDFLSAFIIMKIIIQKKK